MKQLKQLQVNPAQSNCISIAMDPTGDLFAVGASDALVTIWDIKNLVCLRTVDRSPEPTLLS